MNAEHVEDDDTGVTAIQELVMRNLQLAERRDSLVARIASDVAVRIIEGELAPGADLNSVELAQRFGTSRTPVREALMLLEKQGLVAIPARRRPSVTPVDGLPIEEIYRTRALLTGYTAARVAEARTDDDLDTLAACLERMRSAWAMQNIQAYFWANVAWGDEATRIAGNSIVSGMLDQLGLRSMQLRRRSMALPGRLAQSMTAHEELYTAFQQRDSRLASLISHKAIRDAYLALTGDDATEWRL